MRSGSKPKCYLIMSEHVKQWLLQTQIYTEVDKNGEKWELCPEDSVSNISTIKAVKKLSGHVLHQLN